MVLWATLYGVPATLGLSLSGAATKDCTTLFQPSPRAPSQAMAAGLAEMQIRMNTLCYPAPPPRRGVEACSGADAMPIAGRWPRPAVR